MQSTKIVKRYLQNNEMSTLSTFKSNYYKISKPCSLKNTIPNNFNNIKELIKNNYRRIVVNKIFKIHKYDMYNLSSDTADRYFGMKGVDTFSGIWYICSQIYEDGVGDLDRLTEIQKYINGDPYKSLKEISKLS